MFKNATALEVFSFIVIVLTVLSVIAILISMIFARPAPLAQRSYYDKGQPWTFGPVLLSAVDEKSVAPAHHDEHTIAAKDLVGGSAHGSW